MSKSTTTPRLTPLNLQDEFVHQETKQWLDPLITVLARYDGLRARLVQNIIMECGPERFDAVYAVIRDKSHYDMTMFENASLLDSADFNNECLDKWSEIAQLVTCVQRKTRRVLLVIDDLRAFVKSDKFVEFATYGRHLQFTIIMAQPSVNYIDREILINSDCVVQHFDAPQSVNHLRWYNELLCESYQKIFNSFSDFKTFQQATKVYTSLAWINAGPKQEAIEKCVFYLQEKLLSEPLLISPFQCRLQNFQLLFTETKEQVIALATSIESQIDEEPVPNDDMKTSCEAQCVASVENVEDDDGDVEGKAVEILPCIEEEEEEEEESEIIDDADQTMITAEEEEDFIIIDSEDDYKS